MRISLTTCGVTLANLAGLANAAEPVKSGAEKLRDFGLADSTVSTPGYGRVLLVFALIVALAWGAAWILRRYGARFRVTAIGVTTSMRPVARCTLPGGVACHVIEAQGRQVLITVSRHGVTSLLLGDAPVAAPPGQNP
jgi:hypothetical protein